jgi:hypothetical protein
MHASIWDVVVVMIIVYSRGIPLVYSIMACSQFVSITSQIPPPDGLLASRIGHVSRPTFRGLAATGWFRQMLTTLMILVR